LVQTFSPLHASKILLATKPVIRREFQLQAERRLRPLARRRLIKARPERVAMRARKPCVRARLIRLGLYVKLMIVLLHLSKRVANSKITLSYVNENIILIINLRFFLALSA